MSKILEDIKDIEFVEANVYVSSTTIRYSFTRVALKTKTNIKTKEVFYIVEVGNRKPKEFVELGEACKFFDEIMKQK